MATFHNLTELQALLAGVDESEQGVGHHRSRILGGPTNDIYLPNLPPPPQAGPADSHHRDLVGVSDMQLQREIAQRRIAERRQREIETERREHINAMMG